LLVNAPEYAAQAELIREKGTDRGRFFRGEVDKYTWQTVGSSFLPGELVAAFLWAQLEEAGRITITRLARWERYHELLTPLQEKGVLRRPVVPEYCVHNAHMYYVLLAPGTERRKVLETLAHHGVSAVFHYVPLHSSPAGMRYGRVHGELPITESTAERLIRLPLWIGLTDEQQDKVVRVLEHAAMEAR
jgi:dTDP-4-amino-4,6-dideoxygalactose transaminase